MTSPCGNLRFACGGGWENDWRGDDGGRSGVFWRLGGLDWLEFGCGEVDRFEDFPSAMVKSKGMESVDEIIDIRGRAADFFRLLFKADNHFGGGGVGDLEVTDDEG